MKAQLTDSVIVTVVDLRWNAKKKKNNVENWKIERIKYVCWLVPHVFFYAPHRFLKFPFPSFAKQQQQRTKNTRNNIIMISWLCEWARKNFQFHKNIIHGLDIAHFFSFSGTLIFYTIFFLQTRIHTHTQHIPCLRCLSSHNLGTVLNCFKATGSECARKKKKRKWNE